MAFERIAKTIEDVLKGITLAKKDTKQIIYDTIIEQLDAEEKKHIQPYDFRKNIVTVHIDSPARMYAFNLKKKQLLAIVQKKAGEGAIKDIKLRIGIIK